ncbi:MAG: amidohydrolase family protein [Dehalococcoidia bacterium]|jgi:dihydroorotase (multifunctional complex type)|nr:amidohydrolase family protein [Dehalococcoidia bacterium]MDP7470529.1 amidohydrolase family protein [Dehalococcoidia bacterium]
MADLVIRNAQVITPQGMVRGGVAVEGEKISAVTSDTSLPQGQQDVDAGGLVLLPGLIDPHCHMGLGAARGQGRQKFEQDLQDVSVEAAVGGITTIITSALFGRTRETLLPCLAEAKERGSQASLVDFRLNAFLLHPPHIAEVPLMLSEDITSFKFLLAYRGEEGRQVGVEGITWGFVYQGFEAIARHAPPALAMIHAEEADIMEMLRERLQAEGRQDLAAWSDSRPGICEAMHIFSAGLIAQQVGAPMYVVHTSAKESMEAARFFRNKGAPVYIETCPHYLVLTKQTGPHNIGKVNPPLREDADRKALWQAIADGTVDTIGSDHGNYSKADKEGSIWDIMPGFPSLGATLALLVSEGINKGRLSWDRLAQITSENTARLFNLYPRKGVIQLGADADLVIVDPLREWVLDSASMHSASEFTVYDGTKVKGKAIKVFQRGRLLVDDGHVKAQAPLGRFIPSQ